VERFCSRWPRVPCSLEEENAMSFRQDLRRLGRWLRPARPAPRPWARQRPLHLESLEDRVVPAVSITLNTSAVLTVAADALNHTITVWRPIPATLSVSVLPENVTQTYKIAHVNQIIINAGGGDDTINLDIAGPASVIPLGVAIDTGTGSDLVNVLATQ